MSAAGYTPTPLPKNPRRPFVAAERRRPWRLHVLIISSGSVASIKVPLMVAELCKDPRISVQVAATTASLSFYTADEVLSAARQARAEAQMMEDEADEGVEDARGASSRFGIVDVDVDVWSDQDEWGAWKKVGDPILHIELRRWADIVLVAPCSANMLAKIAGGICDNLATSILRALQPSTPTYLFPAMNTAMYQHPLTAPQLRTVTDVIGYTVVGPQPGKSLACGDVGPGAMTEWREIVGLVMSRKDELIARQDEAPQEGKSVAVAAAEPIGH